MRTRLRRSALGIVVLGVAALAGCTSNQDGGSPSGRNETPSSSAAAPGTTLSTASAPAPSAASSAPTAAPSTSTSTAKPLASLLLTRDDLPAQFNMVTKSKPYGFAQFNDALRACLSKPLVPEGRVDAVTSSTYSYEPAAVQSGAMRFRTAADLRDEVALFDAPGVDRCFRSLVAGPYRPNAQAPTAKPSSFEILTGDSDGPKNVVCIVRFGFTGRGNGGVPFRSETTIIYATGPRVLVGATLYSYGMVFNQQLLGRLERTLATRAANA